MEGGGRTWRRRGDMERRGMGIYMSQLDRFLSSSSFSCFLASVSPVSTCMLFSRGGGMK